MSSELKKEKMKAKAAFTRRRNRLFMLIEGGLSPTHEIREQFDALSLAMEGVFSVVEALESFYANAGDVDKQRNLSLELEFIAEEFEEAERIVEGSLHDKRTKLSRSSQSFTDRSKEPNAEQQSIQKKIADIQQEVTKQEEEFNKIVKEIEQSFQGLQKQQHEQRDGVSGGVDNMTPKDPTTEDIVPSSNEKEEKSKTTRPTPVDIPHQGQTIKTNESSSSIGKDVNVVETSSRDVKPQGSQTELTETRARSSEDPTKTPNLSNTDRKSLLAGKPKQESSKEKAQEAQSPLDSKKGIQEDMFTLPAGGFIPSSTPICYRTTSNFTAQQSLEMDSSRLLTRVPIPKFHGDKRNYESWKAAFMSCVDNTTATPEYKLLRLRNSLEGEALKVKESLGHSDAAYEVAKERLDRKYGGKRRQIMLRLDELERFKPLRDGNAKDLEHFAELLDVITVNLRDAGQESELGNGALYINLQKKLNENLLSKYHRWIYEKKHEESVEMLREFVNQESEFLTTASETIKGLGKKEVHAKTFVTPHVPEHGHQQQFTLKCKVCEQAHRIWNCDKFKALKVSERWRKAKELSLCYRCLDSGHSGKTCPRSRVCNINACQLSHHRLLHEDSKGHQKPLKPSTEGEPKERTHTTTTLTAATTQFTALRTVPLYLINGTKKIMVNALLDDASSKTYLNSDIAAELGLEGTLQELTVNVLNDNQETLHTSLVEFQISSLDGKTSCNVLAYTTERVTGSMKVIDWNQYKQKWNHLRSLQFPTTGPRPIVDLLIGVDHAHLMYAIEEVRGQTGDPIARLTPLGWTCVGPTTQSVAAHTSYAFHSGTDELNNLIRRFWDVEEPTSSEPITPDDKVAKKIVAESISFTDGHYCVSMPWKRDKHSLPDSYNMALKRLQNTEKRLLSSNQLGKDYTRVIKSYQECGYIRKVSPEENKPAKEWYLPHFPVLRPDKATTKTRVVFDASAKCQDSSLNDMLYQGPKLQNDLTTVLLRFRRDPIALMCDIKEMYLQIKVKEEDRPYQRFLWRDLETDKEPDVYEFERVVFGVASSPFLAQFVAQHHARQHQGTHPLAADTILNSTYMDDSMDSTTDVKAAIELYQQLSQLWASAGMHARKWLSNSQEVLQAIPAADCVSEVDLDKGELPVTKTLGVTWSPTDDQFKFQVHLPKHKYTSTKREFLKGIATLFDPLGFLTPYIIRARVLLQSMWTSGIDWDEPLNPELKTKAQNWFDELPELSKIHIPRCLRFEADVKEATIHTFVDASVEAYGAVTYVRHVYVDGTVSCNLVASKSKVAPLHAVSIPRLELMAAIVGLRQAERIAPVLKVAPAQSMFWSDSMDVLFWIRGQSRQFKPFVANRVGEIHKSTNPEQWRHVPTKENPADLLTRGQSVSQLKDEKTWWEGPSFLKSDEAEWPVRKIEVKVREDKEIRKQFRTNQEDNRTFVSEQAVNRLEPTRYSSWRKLSRVLARVLRFPGNCQLLPDQRVLGPLSPEELISSEQCLIKKAQEQAFAEEIKALKAKKHIAGSSKLLPLNPFIDQDGIVRSNGRLCYAEYLPWETRFPIILPKDNPITKLIIKEHHEQTKHGGTNQVLAQLSSKYWIISAREAIREWERECMECRRRKTTPIKPVMAPLPALRTRMSMRAFCQTSVDYAGPFYTKQGRGKSRQKRYLCLFTCLSTRAIHLEMAYNLDTDSFLNAFYRMTARRGVPEDMISDNGTNFVSADRELKELLAALDTNKIQDATAAQGVKWQFNPPGAPHFNGVHEIMVKAAKKAINHILRDADINDEELASAIVGAEGLINSRPLTYQSANPADTVPLTPNHFLHGQLGGRFAPESVDTTVFNPRKRWRRVQELVRHFWHSWMKEWLPGLNSRKKWFRHRDNLNEGDVVILMSPDTPRGKWPLGRIIKTKPGADGQVRVADVQVGKTVFTRPVVKLCPLEHQ